MTREEAIKTIKLCCPYIRRSDCDFETAMRFLIPELRESEDERVRKALVKVFEEKAKRGFEWQDGIPNNTVLAWLEKQKEATCVAEITDRLLEKEQEILFKGLDMQKEQKPYTYEESKLAAEDRYNENYSNDEGGFCHEQSFLWGFEEGVNWCERHKSPQKEQKPAEWSEEHIADVFEKVGLAKIVREQGNDELTNAVQSAMIELSKGCQPEWNEDYREEDIQTRFAFYTYKDEDGVLYLSNVFVEESSRNHGFGTRILRAAEKVAETIGATTISLKVKQDSYANAWYRKNGYGYVAFEDGYDWLEKNLEYMKPKKLKPEWSEEDIDKIVSERARKSGTTKTEMDFYRQGVRDAFNYKGMRSRWRPSEEQMKYLEWWRTFIHPETTAGEVLKSLCDDLKKL